MKAICLAAMILSVAGCESESDRKSREMDEAFLRMEQSLDRSEAGLRKLRSDHQRERRMIEMTDLLNQREMLKIEMDQMVLDIEQGALQPAELAAAKERFEQIKVEMDSLAACLRTMDFSNTP